MQRIKLTNFLDTGRALAGDITADRVRSVEIDAFVETGATA